MMKHFPVFLLIIPAALIVVLLMLFLSFHLEMVVRLLGSWFFGEEPWRYELLFYLAAAAIPLLSGILMCFAVMFISGIENRNWERERKEDLRRRAGIRPWFMESVDSINASIEILRELSARMKGKTTQLSLLSREPGLEEPERDREALSAGAGTDTFSVTLNNSRVSGLRVIYPAGFMEEDPGDPSFPQGPFPPHEFRQKIWYFPNI
jgi:hypothetical protein